MDGGIVVNGGMPLLGAGRVRPHIARREGKWHCRTWDAGGSGNTPFAAYVFWFYSRMMLMETISNLRSAEEVLSDTVRT